MTGMALSTTRLSRLKPCIAAFALCSAMASGQAQPVPDAQMEREFEAAMQAYERNHWQDAFDALAKLADKGHSEATRVALLMHRFGPVLYGSTFVVSRRQEDLWARR